LGHEEGSPFKASLGEVVARLGWSRRRRELIRGLIELRQGLRGVGIGLGSQWIDGTFTEDIDEPEQMDVTTWYSNPTFSLISPDAKLRRWPHLFSMSSALFKFGIWHHAHDMARIQKKTGPLDIWFKAYRERYSVQVGTGRRKGLVWISLENDPHQSDEQIVAQLLAREAQI